MTPFIVAELSKNWSDGESRTPWLLGELFERAIEVNRLRGYRLHSFQFHQLMVSTTEMTETLVAVFEAQP